MDHWEYIIIEGTQHILNARGREGWEAVAVVDNEVLMKRRIPAIRNQPSPSPGWGVARG